MKLKDLWHILDEDNMHKTTYFLFLSALLFLVFSPSVLAEENKINVTYIAFSPSDALELASQKNLYNEFIEYTYIPAYNFTTHRASDELLAAGKSGFLETQDVIFCQMLDKSVYASMDENFKAASDNGTSLMAIQSSDTPSYFAYDSNGSVDDPICNYYNNMSTEGGGLENAEDLLIYLVTEGRVLGLFTSFNESVVKVEDCQIYDKKLLTLFQPDNP